MGIIRSGLHRRLQKLEFRGLAHRLDARPEGYWKRLFMERIEVISQRIQAKRDCGEYVAPVDVEYVKQRLRVFLDEREKRA